MPATKVNNSLDFLSKASLLNAILQPLSAAPGSPGGAGQFYYNTASNKPQFYDGTSTWANNADNSDKLNNQSASYYTNFANTTGTRTHAAISDFDAQVHTSSLDQMASATGNYSMGGNKLTNLGNGTATTDAVNLGQVQSLLQGLTPKPAAQWATAAALPSCTYSNGTSGVGATLTGNSNGSLSVDGGSPSAGQVVLVKNQASGLQDGLYDVTQPGDGSHPFILTRNTSMDTSGEFGGAFVVVESGGTANGNTMWLCNTNAPTVGTTAISFVQMPGATSLTPGDSTISISGNNITAVAGSGLVVSSGLAIDTSIVVRKYAGNIGDGSTQTIAVSHNLGTQDVVWSLRSKSSSYDFQEVYAEATDANTLTLYFLTAPGSGASQLRVIVHG